MADIRIFSLLIVWPSFFPANFEVYDTPNGSVFEVAAEVNGVPYLGTKSFASSSWVHMVSALKKIVPLFVILQFVLL